MGLRPVLLDAVRSCSLARDGDAVVWQGAVSVLDPGRCRPIDAQPAALPIVGYNGRVDGARRQHRIQSCGALRSRVAAAREDKPAVVHEAAPASQTWTSARSPAGLRQATRTASSCRDSQSARRSLANIGSRTPARLRLTYKGAGVPRRPSSPMPRRPCIRNV